MAFAWRAGATVLSAGGAAALATLALTVGPPSVHGQWSMPATPSAAPPTASTQPAPYAPVPSTRPTPAALPSATAPATSSTAPQPPGYPQPGAPQPGYPRGYPQRPGYPQPGQTPPQGGYQGQPGGYYQQHPQAGVPYHYPQPGYPQGYPYPPQPQQPPAQPAGADQGDDEPSGFGFAMALGTDFPLGFGPQLTLEIPGRLFVQGTFAWMPAAYGSAIVGLIEAFGKDEALLGPVIEDALADSFVFRASLGWRPFPSAGFELFAGYTTISVSGTAPPQVVADIIEGDLAKEVKTQLTEDMSVDAQLHNFHVGLGWRWLALEDHLLIRAALGYTQTVGSSSSISVSQDRELEARLAPVFTEQLHNILTNDVKLPVISLNGGYRF